MIRIPDRFPIVLALGTIAVVGLVMIAARISWAGGDMAEQTVYGGAASGAPWWVTAGIVLAPGAVAVLLTIASGVMVRRVNRAAGKPPLSVMASIKWTLAFGALWGPLVSFGFAELVYSLTNVATSWKAVVVAPFITGIASMIAYDMLRWYTQKRHPGIYGLLSVKHRKDAGHAGGNGDDGDLTYYAAQGEDDTIPRD